MLLGNADHAAVCLLSHKNASPTSGVVHLETKLDQAKLIFVFLLFVFLSLFFLSLLLLCFSGQISSFPFELRFSVLGPPVEESDPRFEASYR